MQLGHVFSGRVLLAVAMALFVGLANADDRDERQLLAAFIGEVDSIISLAESSANNIPGFAVNSFVKEMGTIRHSLEVFVETGHTDQNDVRKIHGEYGARLGQRDVFDTLYKKVLLLEEHVHAAKAKTDESHIVDYEILEIELDIVEVGLEGVMRGGRAL